MALDNFRKINITLNKANQHVLEPQIAKVGDVNGRELVVQIIDGGVIKDQTGVVLKLNWQHANGNQGSETFSALDASQGVFSVYYPENMLYRGTVTANISINDGGNITNSLNFQIAVKGDVFDGSAVEVDGVLFTIKDLKDQIEERDDNIVVLRNRQDAVESQFETLQQEMTNKDVISAPELIQARGPYSTIHERLEAYRYSYSVKDFGAVGDGVTDDTDAIQATVDYVASIGGGTVFFPVGVYRTTKSIKWLSYVKALGCGMDVGGSGIYMDGTLFSAIINVDGLSNGDDGDNPDVWLHNCSFENMYIDGAGLTHTASSADGKGIFILYMKRPIFRDVVIKNTIGTGFGCDFLVDGIFDNCHAANCGRNWTAGGVGQSGIGIGTGAVEEENVVISNCTAKDCGNYGFFVETQQNTKGIQSKYAKFIGCHAENNRINFGNKGSGATQFSTITSEGGTIGIQLTEKSKGDIFTNVSVNNAEQYGMYISADYEGDLQMTTVSFDGNRKNIEFIQASTPIKKISMTSVKSKRSQFFGLEINRPITNLSVIGGGFEDNGTAGQAGLKAGIRINSDITNFIFDGVDFGELGTQQIGIQAKETVKLKDGIFSNINAIAFGQENGLRIFDATHENVKISNVLGITDYQSGTGNFGGSYTYVGITFPQSFVKAPKQVNIANKGTEPLWATDITRFGFIARKPSTSVADFEWRASL